PGFGRNSTKCVSIARLRLRLARTARPIARGSRAPWPPAAGRPASGSLAPGTRPGGLLAAERFRSRAAALPLGLRAAPLAARRPIARRLAIAVEGRPALAVA